MQMHRSRRTYEPGRPVTPWVYAIARHVYLMKRRSAAGACGSRSALVADARADDVPHDALDALADGDACGARCAVCPPISARRC